MHPCVTDSFGAAVTSDCGLGFAHGQALANVMSAGLK
jgi:hypothetical protein